MARRKKEDSYDALTVSMPISVTLNDGTTATGMLWLHPSRRGRFEVEYNGMRDSDHRTDYTSGRAYPSHCNTYPQGIGREDHKMTEPSGDFLTFERIGIEGGERQGRTAYTCLIKSLLKNTVIELSVRIELPHSDKRLSEIEHEIALAIHEATNPTRLRQRPS